MNPRRAIIVFAILIRLAMGLYRGIDGPPPVGSDEVEYDTYAWNLAQGNGYRGPSPDVSDQDHLTAYRPPGPSLVWAALYRVGGHHRALVRITNCILGGVACWLIILLGARCFNEQIGLWAAAAWAVWPVDLFVTPTILSEPLAIASFLALMLTAMMFAEKPTAKLAIVTGLWLGINLLVHPSRLFFVPMLGLWLLIQLWRQPAAIMRALLIPIVGVICLAPWVIRNHRVFGRVIPFSTMGGSVLLQGNNRIVADSAEYWGYNVWDTDIPEYRDQLKAPNDEVLRDSVAKSLAVSWLKGNISRIPLMTLKKIGRGWTPLLQAKTALPLRVIMFFSWGPVLVLMLIGIGPSLIWFWRRRHPGWILHMAILHMLIIHAIFFGIARYRLLAEPACLLIAGFGLVWLLTRLGRPNLLARLNSEHAPA